MASIFSCPGRLVTFSSVTVMSPEEIKTSGLKSENWTDIQVFYWALEVCIKINENSPNMCSNLFSERRLWGMNYYSIFWLELHLKGDTAGLISDTKLLHWHIQSSGRWRSVYQWITLSTFWLSPAYLTPNLALLYLLVRMTFDQSSGHGNMNHFLVVMVCMHLLGKGEPF